MSTLCQKQLWFFSDFFWCVTTLEPLFQQKSLRMNCFAKRCNLTFLSHLIYRQIFYLIRLSQLMLVLIISCHFTNIRNWRFKRKQIFRSYFYRCISTFMSKFIVILSLAFFVNWKFLSFLLRPKCCFETDNLKTLQKKLSIRMRTIPKWHQLDSCSFGLRAVVIQTTIPKGGWLLDYTSRM